VLVLLGYEDKPFVEFLKSKKLTDTVCHYVQHAIAMVTDDASTIEVTLLVSRSSNCTIPDITGCTVMAALFNDD